MYMLSNLQMALSALGGFLNSTSKYVRELLIDKRQRFVIEWPQNLNVWQQRIINASKRPQLHDRQSYVPQEFYFNVYNLM